MSPTSTENSIQLAVPLKHAEDTYMFTFYPEFPGPLTIEIVSSRVREATLATKREDLHTRVFPNQQHELIHAQKDTVTLTLHNIQLMPYKKHTCELGMYHPTDFKSFFRYYLTCRRSP